MHIYAQKIKQQTYASRRVDDLPKEKCNSEAFSTPEETP
jgi:hypothetical protein